MHTLGQASTRLVENDQVRTCVLGRVQTRERTFQTYTDLGTRVHSAITMNCAQPLADPWGPPPYPQDFFHFEQILGSAPFGVKTPVVPLTKILDSPLTSVCEFWGPPKFAPFCNLTQTGRAGTARKPFSWFDSPMLCSVEIFVCVCVPRA